MNEHPAVTEAELHAYIDGQLPAARQREIETYLSGRPEELQRLASYRAQKRELHALFDPVLDEALPQRVAEAASPRTPWFLQRLAAGVAIALLGGAAGWGLRAGLAPEPGALAANARAVIAMASASGFAQRAAVAHAVYTPDARRPVEIDAAHEDQLIAWLSKRMGAPMQPPHLQSIGYALEGGRLLPGGQGPVAQFMYQDAAGAKLTLYVSNEFGDLGGAAHASAARAGKNGENGETAFRFAQQGGVGVFYWVEGRFGYAISADADRAALARVSAEVYRQLAAAR
jgi:anti-sigma factor RsiW